MSDTVNTYELIERAQAGDREARDLLVSQNTGLIWSVVRKFHNRGIEMEDLFQIGAIGLIRCIDKFDTSFSVRFSTYAVPMIMGEIKRFLRDDGLLKVSRPLRELSVRAKREIERIQHEFHRSPTMEELAATLNTDTEELALALESGYEVESIYATSDPHDGQSSLLIDKIKSENSHDESIVDSLTLKQILATLPARERTVIFMRYFQEKTQAQVAEAIGVSQVQISRIEKKVIERIREEFLK